MFSHVRQCVGERLRWRQLPWPLIASGVVSELIYLLSLYRFPLWRYFYTPLADLGKLTLHDIGIGNAFLLLAMALFLLYGWALYQARKRQWRHTGEVIILFAFLFSVTLLLVYPWGAADLYDYALTGKLLVHYRVNPFVVPPASFVAEPWLAYAPWGHATVAYGPVWVMLAAVAGWVAGNDLLASVLAFKLMAWLFYWLTILLIILISRHRASGDTPTDVLFFAWNPLVLLETMTNGHNDVIMVAFVLLALLWVARRRTAWAFASLAASALVKFISAAVTPFLVINQWQRHNTRAAKMRAVMVGLLSFGLTIAAFSLPFWEGKDPLALERRSKMFTTSIPTLIMVALRGRIGMEKAMEVAQVVAILALGAFSLYLAAGITRPLSSLIRATFEINWFYLAFSCLWFQPWYLVWLVGAGAIDPGSAQRERAWLFSLTALWNYYIFGFLWFQRGFKQLPLFEMRALAGVLIMLPPLLLWVGQLLRHRYRTQPT